MSPKSPAPDGNKKKMADQPASDKDKPRKMYRIQGLPIKFDDREKVATEIRKMVEGTVTVFSVAPTASGKLFNDAVVEFHEQAPKQIRGSKMTIDTDFDGMTVLYAPKKDNLHTVDIIAVCGLGGHSFQAFQDTKYGHNWLADDLPEIYPNARIMTYGYDTKIEDSDSQHELEELGSALRDSVESLREVERDKTPSTKPIIFICHSIGGLVVKQAINDAVVNEPQESQELDPNEQDRWRNDPEALQEAQFALQFHTDKILRYLAGIIFLSVPNDGMAMSSLIPMTYGKPNERFLNSLTQDSQLLRENRRKFAQKCNLPNTKIFCFHENKTSATPRMVDGKWEWTGEQTILINKTSAGHCRPWEDLSTHMMGLPRNHRDMIRYRPNDPILDQVLRAIDNVMALAQRMPAYGHVMKGWQPTPIKRSAPTTSYSSTRPQSNMSGPLTITQHNYNPVFSAGYERSLLEAPPVDVPQYVPGLRTDKNRAREFKRAGN